MASHNLLLNEQKTEVVVIAAPNRSRAHTVSVSIDVCGVSVAPKPSIRDNGVVIDEIECTPCLPCYILPIS